MNKTVLKLRWVRGVCKAFLLVTTNVVSLPNQVMTSEFYLNTSLYSTPWLFNYTISAHGFTQNSRSSRVSISESFHLFLKFPVASTSIVKWKYHSSSYFLKINFHLSYKFDHMSLLFFDTFTPASFFFNPFIYYNLSTSETFSNICVV
jgi:hypothetical protein